MRQTLRWQPVAYLPLIDDYVQEMQDHGIVEPRVGSECVTEFGRCGPSLMQRLPISIPQPVIRPQGHVLGSLTYHFLIGCVYSMIFPHRQRVKRVRRLYVVIHSGYGNVSLL